MLRLLSFLLLTFTLTIGSATAQPYNPELERWDYRSDIKFTGTLKLPTKTTTQRNALTAAEGMVIYNTTLDSVQVYRNSSWVTIGGAGASNYWTLNSNQLRPSVEHDGFFASSGGDYEYPAELLLNNVTGGIYRQTLTSRSEVGINADSAFMKVHLSGDTSLILVEEDTIKIRSSAVQINNPLAPIEFSVKGIGLNKLALSDYGDGMSQLEIFVDDASEAALGTSRLIVNPDEGIYGQIYNDDSTSLSVIHAATSFTEITHSSAPSVTYKIGVGGSGIYIDDDGDGVPPPNGSVLTSNGALSEWNHFSPPTYTATEASALTPANGWQIYVSSTNGTFTSVGFWGYVAGVWTALH